MDREDDRNLHIRYTFAIELMRFYALKQQITRSLRWSERYTKTDMVYLTRGSFWMVTRQVVISLISFGMAIAFANLIPKEVYGAYKYVLSTALLLAVVTMSGINTSLTRSVAKGYEGSILPALFTRIRWGLIGSIVAIGIVLYYGIQENMALAITFAVVAIFLPFKSSFSVYQAYWQGKERFDTVSKLGIFQEMLSSSTLVFVLFLTDDLFILILAYFCAQTLASAILFIYTLRHLGNQQTDSEIVPLGKHLSLMGVFSSLANNSLDIILWHFVGPASVAIFAFANRPPQEIRRIFTEAFPIALPRLSQRSKEEIQRTLLPKIAKLYWILIPSAVAYILIAPSVFRWLFPSYMNAVLYSQLLSLTILFAPVSLFGTVFQALGRTRELYITSIMSLVLLIPALIFSAWQYGLMGVIIAWYIVQSIGVILVLYLFKRM